MSLQPSLTPFSQSLQDYLLYVDDTTWRLASFADMRDDHSCSQLFSDIFLAGISLQWIVLLKVSYLVWLFSSGALRRKIESFLN